MAVEINIVSPERRVFIGTDLRLEFVLYGQPSDVTDEEFQALIDAALAADTVPALTPINVAGKDWIWVLRKTDKAADPALIEKASGGDGITVEGTYNADPEVNTQLLVVTLEDTDSYDPDASPAVALKAKKYRHSLKRVDDGFETIMAFGNFQFLQATAR